MMNKDNLLLVQSIRRDVLNAKFLITHGKTQQGVEALQDLIAVLDAGIDSAKQQTKDKPAIVDK
ncbi:MAG: hypothetical protein KAG66_17635 [Methylococcales bacterium]|nr:hypothetical protein [Methylococcales bacterium]